MKFSSFAVASIATMTAPFMPTTNAYHKFGEITEACSSEDAAFVSSVIDGGIKKLLEATETPERRLDPESSFCRINCMGFMPGHCQLVYPDCAPLRRNLLEDEAERSLHPESSNCKTDCMGFMPGTCHLVYPDCAPLRRNLRAQVTDLTTCDKGLALTRSYEKYLAERVKDETCRAAILDNSKEWNCEDY